MKPVLEWNFDIDDYLNYVVPPAPWKHLPYPIARTFGYRKEKPKTTVGNVVAILWAFIGIWCAIAVLVKVADNIPLFQRQGAPLIVGSFGASAVLEFYAIEAPLAQPRNAVFGQVFSAIVGVAVSRLFQLSSNFQTIRWAGGALACAAATSVMALTKTVHPPAGATALMAVTDPNILKLGWSLVPTVLLEAVLMQAVALVVNNINRRFPQYFWTPADLQGKSIFCKKPKADEESTDKKNDDAEKSQEKQNGSPQSSKGGDEANSHAGKAAVVISSEALNIPESLDLSLEERRCLETIQQKMLSG